MAATARTNSTVAGKEINVYLQKPGKTAYTLFGCVTSVDYDSAGADLEETACREGTFKSPGGDIALPVLSLEHLVRYLPTGASADDYITDDEVITWVETAQVLSMKHSKGVNIGDVVKTGNVVLNGYSGKGPQKGNATGSFKANFLSMPVRSVIA